MECALMARLSHQITLAVTDLPSACPLRSCWFGKFSKALGEQGCIAQLKALGSLGPGILFHSHRHQPLIFFSCLRGREETVL